MPAGSAHETEVKTGKRFQFGKNWARFLSRLTVARIKLAEQSLREYLKVERLDGKTFLDVGSGSGLFSLAARRLGARVHSFDYDPQSVACTRELRRRYFQNDPYWVVEEGSVLDREFLARLGTFDVVYAWGVLHHTGAMRQALENVKTLVPVGGKLFIAIYNDQDEVSDQWARIKRTYNALPRPLAALFALGFIGRAELKEIIEHGRRGRLGDWLRTWTEYHTITMRGMSRWHDWIDWIGGHPYERATIEEIVDVYARDGFRMTKLFDCSSGYGCNEFVFLREAPKGIFIETVVSGGNSMARRYGHRVTAPFERGPVSWTGFVAKPPPAPGGAGLYLIRDDELVGPVELVSNRVEIAPAHEAQETVEQDVFFIVAVEERPLEPPFVRVRGKSWGKNVPDLTNLSDNMGDNRRSPVFVFEGRRQLPKPHALHDHIAEFGAGRFSHWGPTIYFSTTDGADPNTSGQTYRLLVAAQRLPAERSMAAQYGSEITGPFHLTAAGWTASLDTVAMPGDGSLFLVRDDSFVGVAVPDEQNRILIAGVDEEEAALRKSLFHVVAGEMQLLSQPYASVNGKAWLKNIPEWAEVGDRVGDDRRSSLFVFENGRQLPFPHAPHVEIDRIGRGRFSHWEDSLYFSTRDDTDPNTNGHSYCVIVARRPPRRS
jgi:2-polyprenyl-3-methyl-5-hydroxy-6-metoxy-1,4-benzoquinol methylase